jgi:rhodanese-related sulfurtransferase
VQAQTAFDRRPDIEIVDVRDPQEWDAGHIDGSRHIPVDELGRRIAELRSDVPVVTVCRTGRRSGRAVELLRSLGVESDHVEGGLTAWSEQGLPLVATGGGPGAVAPLETEHGHGPDEHGPDEHGPDELGPDEHGPEHHDHEEHGELGRGVQIRIMELMAAAHEHFGDREPSEQEVRDFFQQLLIAEGRSQEEVERILS